MDYIVDHTAAGTAISSFLMDPDGAATLPEFTRNKILAAANAPGPVDRYVDVVESLYGATPSLNAAARMLVAQLGLFIAANGWHGGERYQKIAYSMMRRSNLAPPTGVTYQPIEEDPEAREGTVEPAPEPPTP